ncbi:MAG TPA: ribosome-associated ATPase/putative transporter RbbA [Deltaproteobacteria bacterium]|nr:ribosome-associated ATPase/putative transporter RbbA [Deltaproteobacteria bacterium]
MNEAMNAREPVIRIEGLSHRYGKKHALADVSLEIPAGCQVGFIGPDGVGKSTLLGIIAGQKRIRKGSVHVLNGDMRSRVHRQDVCSQIAYIPQGLGGNLYATLSVYENVNFFGSLFGFSRQEREERIRRLLVASNLASFADRPAGALSGGMKQKLGLCCALIHDPDLLIMDEPTTGVDPLSRRQFWETIRDMGSHRGGMSILIATAYMEEAEHLDWLVMMEGGRVLASGTPADLKEKTGRATIEEAYISLLPENLRYGHSGFTARPRIPSGDDAAIEAIGLTKRFGDFTAVDNVSFTIPKGEIFGFVGSNGCGKTTTMKMLTGLLPPTHGEAYIFGSSVEAGSIELRKRIGYMSQMFSLYGELTVRQNLEMHAHLFDLPVSEVAVRARNMAERFGLSDVMDDQTERLPLGIRQRLSLAVAAIHEPEILILDEPTSGVDPVARDHFWDLLIELSREHGVTIFVTTHYMNEASRCDRVALMSMGRVLACDSPDELIRSRGSTTLEETFIACMREDIEKSEIASEEFGERQTVPIELSPARHHKQHRSFDPYRLAALVKRETIELFRDPVRLVTSFIMPPVLLIIFGFGISTDIENVLFGTLDYDRSTTSREYIDYYVGSRYFTETARLESPSQIDSGFQKGDYRMVIEIPPGFEKDLKRGRDPAVGVYLDGTMPFRAETSKNYSDAVHLSYLSDLLLKSGAYMGTPTVRIQPRYWYNPMVRSRYSVAPGLMAVVLMIVPCILTAIGVVREKELGSIANFYSSPMTRMEFLWGKQIPYIVISAMSFIVLMAVILFMFEIPFKGSLAALVSGALLYIIASTGLGLFISAFTQTQIAALVAAFVITVVPSFEFSGLITPVSALTGGARVMSFIFPARYFLSISTGTFTKGIGFPELVWNYVFLIVIYASLLTMTVLLLKKQGK